MKVVLDPLVALEELDGVHDNQALPAGIPAAPRRAMDAVVPMGALYRPIRGRRACRRAS
jgi:hypothetical protein